MRRGLLLRVVLVTVNLYPLPSLAQEPPAIPTRRLEPSLPTPPYRYSDILPKHFTNGSRPDNIAAADNTPSDNPTTDDGVVTLRGFLWPDQVHRRERLDAAIEIARRTPATVDAADAGAWVEEQLAAPVHGVATVVYHSIVLQYLPRASFDRMRAALHDAGRRATAEAPLHWLRMEPAGTVADIRLQSWPHGEDRLLGTSGFHGPPVEWGASPS